MRARRRIQSQLEQLLQLLMVEASQRVGREARVVLQFRQV